MWAISIHLNLQYLADSNLIFICSKFLWTRVVGSMGFCKSYEVGDQKVFGYMAMSRLRSTTLSVGVVWICKNVVMCSPPRSRTRAMCNAFAQLDKLHKSHSWISAIISSAPGALITRRCNWGRGGGEKDKLTKFHKLLQIKSVKIGLEESS